MFFSIDGGDGTGKSTQIELFCRWLGELGHTVITCRDPGSTPLGEAVREMLLHREDMAIARTSDARPRAALALESADDSSRMHDMGDRI